MLLVDGSGRFQGRTGNAKTCAWGRQKRFAGERREPVAGDVALAHPTARGRAGPKDGRHEFIAAQANPRPCGRI